MWRKKIDHNICFWEKRHFFRPKLAKIAGNQSTLGLLVFIHFLITLSLNNSGSRSKKLMEKTPFYNTNTVHKRHKSK
jgi:hypothetical protein